jgi:U3 small nucleolar RNA-associated protein 14
LSAKQAPTNSDDESMNDDIDQGLTKEPSRSIFGATAKKSMEIPLILAPSQSESESNPWLATSHSSALPSSEFSKPLEVRNDEQSSSSDTDDDEHNDENKDIGNVDKDTDQQASTTNASYGVTSHVQDHLQMPTVSKPLDKQKQQTNETSVQHRMNIQEAFADDDVLAEFEKEKVVDDFRC